MKYLKIDQKSEEWWKLKVGKVSGTRFGMVISGAKNSLIEELVNEELDGCIEVGDYESEDMLFGTENERIAIDEYTKMCGIEFNRGGVIMSDFSLIHMSSPDAINVLRGIVVEVKCTMHGKTQISRFRFGIDSKYKPQVLNYFACSDDVKEVHWISYCPFRPGRPIVVIIVTLDTVFDKGKTVRQIIAEGRLLLKKVERDAKELKEQFTTINF